MSRLPLRRRANGLSQIIVPRYLRTSRKLATVDGGENFFVTPRTWLGSARNFAKTRFGRFQRFVFRRRKKKSTKISDRKFCFSQILHVFQGATAKGTSKSDSSSNFALDGLILRSVRPKIAMNMSVFGSENVSVG